MILYFCGVKIFNIHSIPAVIQYDETDSLLAILEIDEHIYMIVQNYHKYEKEKRLLTRNEPPQHIVTIEFVKFRRYTIL